MTEAIEDAQWGFSVYAKYKIHEKHDLTSWNGVSVIRKTTGSQVLPEIEEKGRVGGLS